MTTVEIDLPDELAKDAATAGLLAPDAMAVMLRERLRAGSIERLRTMRAALAADPLEPMTPDEIEAEIAAARAEHLYATGS